MKSQKDPQKRLMILDLCCGKRAIGVSLSKLLKTSGRPHRTSAAALLRCEGKRAERRRCQSDEVRRERSLQCVSERNRRRQIPIIASNPAVISMDHPTLLREIPGMSLEGA
jgi:hypothetical protein